MRIESDPKEWPAMAAKLAAQRAQREAIQATVRKVCHVVQEQKAAPDSHCYILSSVRAQVSLVCIII